MPISTQVSLSVELVKLAQHLPLRASFNSVINLVRDFKRSGSDFLVEEDLIAIFGRGRVVQSMENHFRDVVKAAAFATPKPLYEGAGIFLDAGAGPTLRRALRDGHSYMATVIQLSFLGSMHEETTLAATLTDCMLDRYEKEVQNATPDPDYAGILGTLQACTSQTSQYPWEILIALVGSKFPQSAPWFLAFQSPLKSLSPNLLLGAMDYLYLVQSLPEDRIMVVENQMGLIPITVWAHCILGLRVLVKNSPDGDVSFGTPGSPQVIIHWSQKWSLHSYRWEVSDSSTPIVYLLDAEMEVLLKTEPNEHEGVKIEGLEHHRLKGYGTTFLRRLFNMESIIVDDDPIYAEVTQYTVAVAIVMSKSMHRVSLKEERSESQRDFEECYMKIETSRILESSELLFSGIEIDRRSINGYVERLVGVKVEDMPVPPTVKTYIERPKSHSGPSYATDFHSYVTKLASWVVLFARVTDVQSCSDMPLVYDPSRAIDANIKVGAVLWPRDSGMWFLAIVAMMLGDVGGLALTQSVSEGVFLISHKGWSTFYGSVGDNDPGSADCESICIRQGVPTNLRTQERKYLIVDAPRIWPKVQGSIVMDRGESFLPRCASPVIKRTELYSSRGESFCLSIRYDIDESEALQGPGVESKFSIYASYQLLHEGLCNALKTEPCMHRNGDSEIVQLGLGVVTTKGFDWVNGESHAERICLSLVKGDPRARWLMLAGLVYDGHPLDLSRPHSDLSRRVLLRCNNCCEDCAVKQASAREGKWLIIL